MTEDHDHSQRLHYGLRSYVVERRPGRILLGGLGVLGVGQMWFDERPEDKDRPGYSEAPFYPDPPPDQF